MNEKIKKVVREIYGNAQVRALETSAGWLLEVIDDAKNTIGPLKFTSQLLTRLSSKLPELHFWKVFSYSHEQGRYLQNGTLHTLEKQWENGFETTILSGQDCYLDLPEFDVEFLSLGNYNGHKIPCLQSIGHDGKPILPYQEQAKYLWLEAMGGAYYLSSTIIENSRKPSVVWLTLKE